MTVHQPEHRPSAAGSPNPAQPEAAAPAHTNRLARETSPYLLQHAHNPVDWWQIGRA
ncbi:MAG: DUF255 domain-containing protein, partial [Phycisphaerales bacterium JB041]